MNKPSMRLSTLFSTPLGEAALAAPLGVRQGCLVPAQALHARVAQWTQTLRLQQGTELALYLDDSLEFACALFGAWHAGKTVWLAADLTPATLAALAGRVSLFVVPESRELSQPVLTPADLPAPSAEHLPLQPLPLQHLGVVVFTSGSSGEPQPIPKTLQMLFQELDALEQLWGPTLGEADVLGMVSHQHIYGLLFRVLWPWAAGRRLHAERHAFAEALWAAVQAQGGKAVVVASPSQLRRLPPQLERLDVAAVFCSGGPLPPDALPACERAFGCAPVEVFGSSETGGIAWRQRKGVGPWAWQPLPDVQWRVSEHGQLQLRCAHMPEPQRWVECADSVRPLGAGFELLGRMDRVVKVEGKRVSAQRVEQSLMDGGHLEEVRVLVLDHGGREELAVVAVPTAEGWAHLEREGKRDFVARLQALVATSLERVTLPKRWRFESCLPSNSQGKCTQQALQHLFDPRRPGVRVRSRQTQSVELLLDIHPRLPQFQGHFDGHPIVPGVAQLDWAQRFAHEFLALQGRFAGADAVKFQQVIRPGSAVTLHLSWQAPLLSFSFQSAAGAHASGKLRYESPGV
ncbi:AMP-binding protein [Roseateles sp. BYS180W]|uniref:AMP-binding protein n=1 Tax=Roseateles rivi TaxID=3299028 RepID=A0ABW7FR08_9BURK